MDIKYSTLPEKELIDIISCAETELQKRKQEKKDRLIEAFEYAWKDLVKAGIDICYDESYDSDSVLNFSCIYFD